MLFFSVLLVVYGIGAALKVKAKTEKQANIIKCFVLFPLFALCAFRAMTVGNDTQTYYYGYVRIQNYGSILAAIQGSRYEVGYTCLCYILNKINLSFLEMQILVSLFIYTSFLKFFKRYSVNFSFSCFIFLSLRYAMSTMNVTRMWVAVAILLYSIQYIQDRKLLRFCLIVCVSSLFHVTALVFLLLYPAVTLRVNKKTISITIMISVIFLMLGRALFIRITSIIGRYGGYLNSSYFVFESNIAVYLSLAINVALFALTYFTIGKKDSQIRINSSAVSIDRICVTCGLLVTAIGIVGLGNTIMDRIAIYFGFLFTISLPLSIKKTNNSSNRAILYIALIIALSAQFLVVMILRPGWNGVTPYTFFWQ